MKSVWSSVPKFRYFFYHPLHYLNDVRYAVKWSFQRITRGYCDCDWFNLSYWFSEVVPCMLRELIDGAGHPYDMLPEEWERYLAEMASHIENTQEEVWEKLNQYDSDKEKDKWLNRIKEINEWQEAECHKGLQMMADRFYDLWD